MSPAASSENQAFAPADSGFLVSIAALAFLALGLEIVVDGTALLLTGRIPEVYPLLAQVLLWLLLGTAWAGIQRALVAWLRHRAADPAAPRTGALVLTPELDHRRTTTALVVFVLAVLLAVILPVFLVGRWRVPPIQLYLDLYGAHGSGAWLGMVGFAAYHVGRCLLFALVVVCVQRAAELRWPVPAVRALPLGGFVLGMLLLLPGLVLGGWHTSVTALVCCTLLGVVHNLTGRSLRWAVPATVVVLLFV
jgi:hypothetical protein